MNFGIVPKRGAAGCLRALPQRYKLIAVLELVGSSGDFSISIAEITKAMINNESPQNPSMGFSFFYVRSLLKISGYFSILLFTPIFQGYRVYLFSRR